MKLFTLYDTHHMYGSMTHSRYALETLQLAIDDVYGTNALILEQYKFNLPPKKKPQAKTVKGKIAKPQHLSAAKQAALNAIVPF